ncbi:hypothetical protein [Poseidonibacter lekithochrous]|uniref:hypothetical protein n=1 Tax=Poseidonibacter lekithochrous TaxID=1904463 RepID=UPI0008FCAB76|nr:hypothetical protein [Poseidonibacter lekithochrous]QKJ22190.1 hypothetical protein ALEK_0909 [Poseidonibacter lekithochrous]
MLKTIFICVITIFVFTSCSSSTNNQILTNSKKMETINPIEVKKTSKDYGKISVIKYEKSADNKTKVFLSQCSIMNEPHVSCKGYMYEVMYDEEWLVHAHTQVEAEKLIEVNENKYYLKLQNRDNSKVYNVTGLLELKAKYINYVKLELE